MDLKGDLVRIGFTEYESKVYLALLRTGPATGYQLSKESGVPRSMVYEALGRLSTRGAVLRTEEARATLYSPVPPSMLLDRYEDEQHHLIQSLRESLTALFDVEERGRLWSISGRNSVLAYASRMIASAESELLLIIADAELELLREDIAAAHGRGVVVGALLTGTGGMSCGQIARHPPMESKLQELSEALVVVGDSREALIASTDLDGEATVTANRNLVIISRQFIWMELFTQRIATHLGGELLKTISAEDRQVLERFQHSDSN
jgi:Cd2+/Zn2+-exporting ATPase